LPCKIEKQEIKFAARIASNRLLQEALFPLREHAPQTYAQLRSSSSRAQRLQPITRDIPFGSGQSVSRKGRSISGTLCVTHSAAIAWSKIKNEGQVALEIRNSPKVVKGHYFEIVDERRASTRFQRVVSFRSPAKKSAKTPSNGYDPRLFSSKKNNAV
jgi:hypothetical protein